MSRSSSAEHSRAIDDELPEDAVFSTTLEFHQAEIAYRQERIRRDFRRAGWFSRSLLRPRPVQQRLTVRARHAD